MFFSDWVGCMLESCPVRPCHSMKASVNWDDVALPELSSLFIRPLGRDRDCHCSAPAIAGTVLPLDLPFAASWITIWNSNFYRRHLMLGFCCDRIIQLQVKIWSYYPHQDIASMASQPRMRQKTYYTEKRIKRDRINKVPLLTFIYLDG